MLLLQQLAGVLLLVQQWRWLVRPQFQGWRGADTPLR